MDGFRREKGLHIKSAVLLLLCWLWFLQYKAKRLAGTGKNVSEISLGLTTLFD